LIGQKVKKDLLGGFIFTYLVQNFFPNSSLIEDTPQIWQQGEIFLGKRGLLFRKKCFYRVLQKV
jgi:hypothetical protein